MAANSTAVSPAERIAEYRYKPGHPGGPGRPVGSRNRLNELAAKLLLEDFTEHGAATIARVRQTKPEVYLAAVVALMPKQAQKIESPLVDISDGELEQLEQHLREMRARNVAQLIELEPQAAPTTPAEPARG